MGVAQRLDHYDGLTSAAALATINKLARYAQ